MTKAIQTMARAWPNSEYTLDDGPWQIPADHQGTVRGEIKTRGPWSTISEYRALAVSVGTLDTEHYGYYPQTMIVHGWRTLSGARESGYDLEGYVSVDGRKRSAFTSSVLMRDASGRLVDVAVLYCRKA